MTLSKPRERADCHNARGDRISAWSHCDHRNHGDNS